MSSKLPLTFWTFCVKSQLTFRTIISGELSQVSFCQKEEKKRKEKKRRKKDACLSRQAHFCRDKRRVLCVCRDKSKFCRDQFFFCRDKWYLWQLPPVIQGMLWIPNCSCRFGTKDLVKSPNRANRLQRNAAAGCQVAAMTTQENTTPGSFFFDRQTAEIGSFEASLTEFDKKMRNQQPALLEVNDMRDSKWTCAKGATLNNGSIKKLIQNWSEWMFIASRQSSLLLFLHYTTVSTGWLGSFCLNGTKSLQITSLKTNRLWP